MFVHPSHTVFSVVVVVVAAVVDDLEVHQLTTGQSVSVAEQQYICVEGTFALEEYRPRGRGGTGWDLVSTYCLLEIDYPRHSLELFICAINKSRARIGDEPVSWVDLLLGGLDLCAVVFT